VPELLATAITTIGVLAIAYAVTLTPAPTNTTQENDR
jgi:hypothetical protein